MVTRTAMAHNDSGFDKEYVAGDGNCFYRCISLGLYGTQERHADVRRAVADRARAAIARGDAASLFPLGSVYLTGATDEATAVPPSEFIERYLAVDNTYSEEIDVVLVQKLLLDPLMACVCIFRKGEQSKTFGKVDFDAYNFIIFIECEHDVHFNLLDVGRLQGTTRPRRVLWNAVPRGLKAQLM